MLPGFNDATLNNIYTKGEYSLKVNQAKTSSTIFEIEAVWVDTGKGIDDRWTISNTTINPIEDKSKAGIQGYSVFSWIFD
jgi:hypothetical protein